MKKTIIALNFILLGAFGIYRDEVRPFTKNRRHVLRKLI